MTAHAPATPQYLSATTTRVVVLLLVWSCCWAKGIRTQPPLGPAAPRWQTLANKLQQQGPATRQLLQQPDQATWAKSAQAYADAFASQYYGSSQTQLRDAVWSMLMASSNELLNTSCSAASAFSQAPVPICVELNYMLAVVTEFVEAARIHFGNAAFKVQVAPPFSSPLEIDLTGANFSAQGPLFKLGEFGQAASDAKGSGTGSSHSSQQLLDAIVLLPMPLLMYYRIDLFQMHNISVPNTWDEVLALARKHNGTDYNGDGQAKYALCFNHAYNCRGGYMLEAIAASLIQTSTQAGFMLSPEDLSPMVSNAAIAAALDLLKQLARYSDPRANNRCGWGDQSFNRGFCMLTFNFDQLRSSASAAPAVAGSIGVALMPGSAIVLNPQTNTLDTCNAAACQDSAILPTPSPAGTTQGYPDKGTIGSLNRPQLFTNVALTMVAGANTTIQLYQDYIAAITPLIQGEVLWVRTVGEGMAALADNSTGTAPLQQAFQAAVRLLQGSASSHGGNGTSLLSMPNVMADLARLKMDHLLWQYPVVQSAVAKFGQLYHPLDVVRFLNLQVQARSYSNIAWEFQQAGASYFRMVYSEAAANATQGNMSAEAIIASMDTKMRMIIPLLEPSFRSSYIKLIGWRPPASSLNLVQSSISHRQGANMGYRASVVSVVVAVALLVALMALAIWLVKRAKHRSLWGVVLPPGMGPASSLVVTDIQSSTTLWEALPAEVMDAALRTHHEVIRKAAADNDGYESTTEGDSFILAFHTPHSALSFCLAAQQQLLAAPWPEDFNALELSDAATVRLTANMMDDSCAHISRIAEQLLNYNTRDASEKPVNSNGKPLCWRQRTTLKAVRWFKSLRKAQLRTRTGSTSGSQTASRQLQSLQRPGGGSIDMASSTASSIVHRSWDKVPSYLSEHQQRPWLSCVLPASIARFLPHAAGKVDPRTRSDAAWQGEEQGRGMDLEQVEVARHAFKSMEAAALLPEEVSSEAIAGMHDGTTLVTSSTLGYTLNKTWQHWVPPPPGSNACSNVLPSSIKVVFRGLRVRMGVHAGLDDPAHVAYNSDMGRMHYSGSFAARAKHVCDTAHGGMVLLTDGAVAQLRLQQVQQTALVLDMGAHSLTGEEAPLKLYQAILLSLGARLSQFPPLRSLKQTGNSILGAPVGHVAIAFMNATGVETLRAWDAEVTAAALRMYEQAVRQEAEGLGGYVVEVANGLCLAAFPHPALAIVWALRAQQALLSLEWPEELLRHELCEEITIVTMDMAGAMHRETCSRGLRVKCGIDYGHVMDNVHGATGAATYRGRVMNRAARISTLASTGKVLCSSGVWELAQHHSEVRQSAVVVESLGKFHLKGMLERQEVLQCSLASGLITAASADGVDLQSWLDPAKLGNAAGIERLAPLDLRAYSNISSGFARPSIPIQPIGRTSSLCFAPVSRLASGTTAVSSHFASCRTTQEDVGNWERATRDGSSSSGPQPAGLAVSSKRGRSNPGSRRSSVLSGQDALSPPMLHGVRHYTPADAQDSGPELQQQPSSPTHDVPQLRRLPTALADQADQVSPSGVLAHGPQVLMQPVRSNTAALAKQGLSAAGHENTSQMDADATLPHSCNTQQDTPVGNA